MLVEDDQEENSQPRNTKASHLDFDWDNPCAARHFSPANSARAIHWFAVHRAAKEHLKLSFRAEGNVFTALTVRNLHVVPTGPAAIEVAEAEYIHAEYNLFSLIRGHADFLSSIETRTPTWSSIPGKCGCKLRRARAKR